MCFLSKLKTFSEKGVSLVQILMTSSAIAGLALVGLKMAEDQKRLVQETYETYLSEYFIEEVNHVLESKTFCSLTLRGLDPADSEVKALQTLSKKEKLSILPVEGVEGAKGTYFENRVKVLGYRLVSSDREASLKKGSTNFQITLQLKESGKKVVKSIPLDFTSDPEGKIVECSRSANSKTKEVKGYWRKEGSGLVLENLSLVIGDSPKRSTLFSLGGSLFIEKTGNELPCNPENEGVLSTSYQDQLKVCHNNEWEIVGEYPINWKKVTRYNEVIATSGTNQKRTAEHRLCYLSGQTRKSLSDRCKIERKGEEFKSQYVLSAITSSMVTKNECEVICVD